MMNLERELGCRLAVAGLEVGAGLSLQPRELALAFADLAGHLLDAC